MSSTTYEHNLKKDITVLVSLAVKDKSSRVFSSFLSVVRNAGQLPQPFWLGAACGGGSCSLSASVARA
jgi:hypothetical protein|nr:MAG TPA: hypothetical protein [Caudoviricetes sp.]